MGRPESPKPFFKGSWWLILITLILSHEKAVSGRQGQCGEMPTQFKQLSRGRWIRWAWAYLQSFPFQGGDSAFQRSVDQPPTAAFWAYFNWMLCDGLITTHNRVGGEWGGRNLDPTCSLFDRTENRIRRRKVRKGQRTCCLFSYPDEIFTQIKQKLLRSTDWAHMIENLGNMAKHLDIQYI